MKKHDMNENELRTERQTHAASPACVELKQRRFGWRELLAAAAALAVVVLGVLGARKLLRRDPPTQTDPPATTEADPAALPLLTVGEGWKAEEQTRYFPNGAPDLRIARILLEEGVPEYLPVFTDSAVPADGSREPAGEAALEDYAKALAALTGESITHAEYGEAGYLAGVGTDTATVRVTDNGYGLLILLDARAPRLDSEEDLVDYWVNTLFGGKTAGRLFYSWLPAYTTFGADEAVQLIPDREKEAQRFLAYSYEKTLLYFTGGEDLTGVAGFTLPRADEDLKEDAVLPASLEAAGSYPVISPAQALELLRAGKYLALTEEAPGIDGLTDERVELVYPTEGKSRTVMPFYRFWIDVGEGSFQACYVPAVRAEYLSDFEGIEFTEPAPTSEPADLTPSLQDALLNQVNPLLTVFAQQGITDLDKDLAGEYELAQFAHIYLKLYEPGAIRWQTVDGEDWETLTAAQVNEALNALLGRTVSPAEGTDYTAQRGDNYAQHESYHDGCFWWAAADGEMYTRFALAVTAEPAGGDVSSAISGQFRVYEALPEYLEEHAFTDLYTIDEAALQASLDAGAIRCCADGEYRMEAGADHRMKMASYSEWPSTEPDEGPAPELNDDPALHAEMEALFGDPAGCYCRALTSEYGDALGVDPARLFRCGIPGADNTLSAEEKTRLQEALSEKGRSMTGSLVKIPMDDMNQVLSELFGTSLSSIMIAQGTFMDDLFGEDFVYLWDYSCLYHFSSEVNYLPIRIETAARTESGSVCVLYRFVHDDGFADEQLMAVLLRQREERWQLLANLPASRAAALLNDPGLGLKADIQALLNDSGGWYSRALSSEFDRPENVDLHELFYDGIPGQGWASREELTKIYGEDLTREDGDWPGPPTDRLPREEMDRILRQYFGVSLEQSAKHRLDTFAYLPETDCYYHCHGDTNQQMRRVEAARTLEDGTVLFTYRNEWSLGHFSDDSSGLWTAALKPDGEGGYQILSNLYGQWITGADVGELGRLFVLTDALRAETVDADGSRTVRELRFTWDGFHYREGDPDSEFSYWAWGEWWIADDHTLHCRLCETREDGNCIGEWQFACFSCSFDGERLTMIQQGENGFHADEAGTEITFAPIEQ